MKVNPDGHLMILSWTEQELIEWVKLCMTQVVNNCW